MSDDLYDDDQEQSDPVRQQREHIKQLEADAKAAKRELALFKAGLADLNDDQRNALLAVVGNEFDADTVKAKAEALFGKKETPSEEAQEEAPKADDLGAFQRASQAAAGSMAPPPPANELMQMRQQVETVGVNQLPALYQKALQTIQNTPGLQFGPAEVVE